METSGANKRPSEPQYQHSRIIPVPFPNGGPFPYFCLLLGKRLLSKISAIETRSARVAVKDYRQQFPTELKLHDSDDQGCNALTRESVIQLKRHSDQCELCDNCSQVIWRYCAAT